MPTSLSDIKDEIMRRHGLNEDQMFYLMMVHHREYTASCDLCREIKELFYGEDHD